MAAQKQKSSSPFFWLRTHKIVSAIALLVLVFVMFFVYEKVALYQNKRAFEQARAAIDTIYADIVSQVGPPDNYRRLSECSRPSREFEQGQLSCLVDTDLVYAVADKMEYDKTKADIQRVVEHYSKLLSSATEPQSSIYATTAPGNNTDSSIYYYKTQQDMRCTAKYTYYKPGEIQLSTTNASKKGLGISIVCSGNAKGQYYPNHIP